MKYFKVSNTQAITNTCNNINWNEFSGCSRLKLSFRGGRVEVHFDTNPRRPPLPTPASSSLPQLLLVLGPVWEQLATTDWHHSPRFCPSYSSVCTSDPCKLPTTIVSVYIVSPWSQLVTCSSTNLSVPLHPSLHLNPSSTSRCHVYFLAH